LKNGARPNLIVAQVESSVDKYTSFPASVVIPNDYQASTGCHQRPSRQEDLETRKPEVEKAQDESIEILFCDCTAPLAFI
jgi:hypothetical protein